MRLKSARSTSVVQVVADDDPARDRGERGRDALEDRQGLLAEGAHARHAHEQEVLGLHGDETVAPSVPSDAGRLSQVAKPRRRARKNAAHVETKKVS